MDEREQMFKDEEDINGILRKQISVNTRNIITLS